MRTPLGRPRREIVQLVKPPAYPFEIFLISKDGNKVKSSNGPIAAPDWDFERARREPLDLLMIPGGEGTRPLLDEKTIQRKSRRCSIGCMRWMPRSGSWRRSAPAPRCWRAGLLDGLPAATNHAAFAWVVPHGPKVLWDSVARWV